MFKNFFRKIAKNRKICAEKNGNYWIKNHVDSTRYKIIFIRGIYQQVFEVNFSTSQNRCKPQQLWLTADYTKSILGLLEGTVNPYVGWADEVGMLCV